MWGSSRPTLTVALLAMTAAGCGHESVRGATEPLPIVPAPIATLAPRTSPVPEPPVPVPRARATMAPNVPEELALPVRDPRFYKRPHRPATLITYEIDVRKLSLPAPELPGGIDPEVLFELAGLYAELARVTPASTATHDAARAEARDTYMRYGRIVAGSDGADSAAYFVALEYELEGDRAVARAAYQALLTQTPDLYPFALLRIGQSELALGDTKAGARTLERLAREFPRSEATRMATAR